MERTEVIPDLWLPVVLSNSCTTRVSHSDSLTIYHRVPDCYDDKISILLLAAVDPIYRDLGELGHITCSVRGCIDMSSYLIYWDYDRLFTCRKCVDKIKAVSVFKHKNITYAYDDKYLATSTYRISWLSIMDSDNQYPRLVIGACCGICVGSANSLYACKLCADALRTQYMKAHIPRLRLLKYVIYISDLPPDVIPLIVRAFCFC